MVWAVGSTAGPVWQLGSTSGASNELSGSVTDALGSAAGTAAYLGPTVLSGAVADFFESAAAVAAYTSPPPTLVQQYTPYQAGETCELGVVGADGVFQIIWSPINNPLSVHAVALTITSTNLVDGAGRVFVTAQRTVVRYGEQGWLFLEQDGEYSGMQATLVAEPGKQHVVLAAPLVAPELGVWAVPDLAAGDMLIWWNALPVGAVEVFPDRSFETDGTVLTFDAEAHANTGLYVAEDYWVEGYAYYGFEYTNTETQDINFGPDPSLTGAVTDFFEIVAGTAAYTATGNAITANLTDFPNTVAGTADTSGFSEWVSPVPLATCTGQALANQTGISYAILPGHVLHAAEAIVVRNDGTTDAQGHFRAQNIFYTAGQPVTLLMRWIEGGRDRFVILYTQLTVQG